ncbi:MAG TPA: hypothetical protein VG317_16005 [Pseudonocardiaceae bacterium]|jgi:hypothetical protein|nr:hypothetical protein [Pseudonocardiaceae bacterium]
MSGFLKQESFTKVKPGCPAEIDVSPGNVIFYLGPRETVTVWFELAALEKFAAEATDACERARSGEHGQISVSL